MHDHLVERPHGMDLSGNDDCSFTASISTAESSFLPFDDEPFMRPLEPHEVMDSSVRPDDDDISVESVTPPQLGSSSVPSTLPIHDIPTITFTSQAYANPLLQDVIAHLTPALLKGPVRITPAYQGTSINALLESEEARLYLRRARASTYFSSSEPDRVFPVLADTGCSVACSGFEEDFDGNLIDGDFGSIKTANGTAIIRGFGLVHWRTMSETGEPLIIKVPCYYCPDIQLRLFSPQDYARYHKQDPKYASMMGSSSWFTFNHQDSNLMDDVKLIYCGLDPESRLFYFYAEERRSKSQPSSKQAIRQPSCPCCSLSQNVHDARNINLTKAQKNLLLDHQRLGHLRMTKVQALYRCPDPSPSPSFIDDSSPSHCDPCLKAKEAGQLTCDPPKCATCEVAKARARYHPE